MKKQATKQVEQDAPFYMEKGHRERRALKRSQDQRKDKQKAERKYWS